LDKPGRIIEKSFLSEGAEREKSKKKKAKRGKVFA
jgi:hypothetical protein